MHEHVEPAEVLDAALDEAGARVALAQVDLDGEGRAARALDQLDRAGGVVGLLGEVGDAHVGALAGEGQGDGAPDAGVGARDQGPLPVEPTVAPVRRLAVIGLLAQVGGAARVLDLLGARIGRVDGGLLGIGHGAVYPGPCPPIPAGVTLRGAPPGHGAPCRDGIDRRHVPGPSARDGACDARRRADRADRPPRSRRRPLSALDDVAPFDGRGELEALLDELTPGGWEAAVRDGDEARRDELATGLDNPSFVAALGAAGWVAPHYEREHGGRGLDEDGARAALSLLAAWEVPHVPRGSGLPLAAPTIQRWSSDDTKRRLLPPLLTGEERWCQLFSEPGAGSDMASLATTAVRDGDEWIVDGQKVWTTFGHESERAMLIARTDPELPKHAGITYFGLDMRAPGVEVRPLVNMAGQREFNEVFLTGVRVADVDRISPVGEGWAAAMTTLGAERFALSGVKRKRRASDEILGGKPFAEVASAARAADRVGVAGSPVERDHLARAATADRLLAWTAERGRARARAGQAPGPEGSITKIAKARTNQRLQELAIDVRGAGAAAWAPGDDEAAEWITQFLRTRANSIEGGTSEIQRNIVGERVLGLPREPDPHKGAAWRDVPRS